MSKTHVYNTDVYNTENIFQGVTENDSQTKELLVFIK